MSNPLKGRATNITTNNKFEKHEYHEWKDDYEHLGEDEFYRNNARTTFLETSPKTIVNTVKSKDIPFSLSMNPYQGCEHGCIYCYARDSHQYWGYNTGLDFERKILVKKNAPQLLDKTLSKKSWIASPIMLSGNTDCYQPCEKDYGITRKILKVFLKHKHPVSIITKNAMIERDIDLLEELASQQLVTVNYTLTSLDNTLKNLLEPRVSSVHKKLKVLETLTQHNIPVNIMMAPIIPALNSNEIFEIAKETSQRGASSFSYTLVRLNNDLGTLFEAWIAEHFPDRKDKVLNQIKEIHGGTLNNSNYNERMTGQGIYAKQINALVNTARRKYFSDRSLPKLNSELYGKFKNGQLSLF